MKKIFFHIVFFMVLIGGAVHAQAPIETLVDTTSIKIGDTFLLTLKTKSPKGSEVVFPKSEQLGAFEVIESYPIDTLLRESTQELIKKYALTQFDSGHYELPQLPVIIGNKPFKTHPINIHVLNVEVDTLKQPLFDIQPISKSTRFNTNWLYMIGVGISVLIGLALYFYIKRKQRDNLSEDDYYSSPYEKAIKKLDKLQEKKNWTRGDAKPYYSDMTFITRSYIEDTFGISAHELTTHEIVLLLRQTLKNKKIALNKSVLEELKKILQAADLVKFAKSQPLDFEITSDTAKISKIIDAINTAYPTSFENQTEKIQLREKRKRNRRRLRRVVPISVSLGLLFIIGLVFTISNSSDSSFIKTLSFNSSKRMLESEWITSTYGANSITVTTPKVLNRYQEPTLQNSLPANIKSIQQFLTGQIKDPVHVLLNTIQFNAADSYEMNQVISHSVNLIAQQFQAKNAKYETSSFENSNGVLGSKIIGNYEVKHPLTDKEETFIFEIVFVRNGALIDEVCVFYEEQDNMGKEIANRVFESILYKNAN